MIIAALHRNALRLWPAERIKVLESLGSDKITVE